MSRFRLKVAAIALCGLVAGAAAIASGTPARPATQVAAASLGSAAQCSALEGRRLGGALVEKAEYIPAGGATISPLVKASSDVCRVSARARPVAGSDIGIRIWLPANWNGKLLGVGGAGLNGGYAAEWFIVVNPMSQGYAAFSTDSGHEPSEEAKWALGQPEKIVDYGHRANHAGTLAAKAVIASYYGRAPSRSYFHGCSNGGRDALIQAQRHPEDYDGIIAGAPAHEWTALMAMFAGTAQIAQPHRGEAFAAKLKLVNEAVLARCDADDGAKDGLISNPTTCRFDPAALQCKAAHGPDCLSQAELATLRAIYRGTRTSDGALIVPGFPPGSEFDWASWFKDPDERANGAQNVFRYMVYDDPTWSWSRFDLGRDYPVLKRRLSSIIDATETDLRPFARRGGRLLMYHGWEDVFIPAHSSIRYYEAVRGALGRRAAHARLFMVPGMGHCFGGSGPNVIDLVGALDDWVEGGTAPERLVSSRHENFLAALTGQPTRRLQTRPVCAWPKTPFYKGAGPVDQEASFICR